jgi:tetratricopeptide (TPR) repeat protein
LSAAARADEPRTVAVAVGNCKEGELLEAMTVFHRALKEPLGRALMDPERVLEQLRPRPEGSLADASRVFEAAQTQFYAGQHGNALDNVRAAITQLQKMPPGANAWPMLARAHVLEALVLKAMSRRSESTDAFRRVLVLDKQYTLDPDYYTPSTIAQFEQLKAQVANARKEKLRVRTTGPVAQVFINGAPVGKTPLEMALEAGRYRVQLKQGDAWSFVHPVKLEKEYELQVDTAFESSLKTTAPLCLTESHGRPDRALKLAALLDAEQVVVLAVEASDQAPPFFSAALFVVSEGGRSRQVGFKPQAGRRDEGLIRLAQDVLVAPVAIADGPRADAPGRASLTPDERAAPPELALTAAPPREPRLLPAAAFWAAGAAALLAGVVVYAVDGADRARVGELMPAGRLPLQGDASHDEAVSLLRRVDHRGTASAVAMSGGVALLGAGALVYFW